MAFEDVAGFKNHLIRKALGGALLVADYSEAALTTITGTAGALVVPATYISMGKLTTDGIASAAEAERSELRGWGDTSAARIDITSENNSLTCTAMETKKAVLDAFYNFDQTGVDLSASGEITFDKPALPTIRDKRVLALAKDVNKNNGLEVFFGIHFPRANLSSNGEQQLANGDQALAYPLTINALVDDAEGTAVRLFWTGPGLAGLATDMGYTVAP